jgi:hypothetical protein
MDGWLLIYSVGRYEECPSPWQSGATTTLSSLLLKKAPLSLAFRCRHKRNTGSANARHTISAIFDAASPNHAVTIHKKERPDLDDLKSRGCSVLSDHSASF